MLADLVRTDRHNHRPVAGDASWPRRSRCWPAPTRAWSGPADGSSTSSAAATGVLPGALAAFGTEVGDHDALAVLQVAPTPTLGRGLSRAELAAVLRRAGRQRGLEGRAAALQAALRTPQLQAPGVVAEAYGPTSPQPAAG